MKELPKIGSIVYIVGNEDGDNHSYYKEFIGTQVIVIAHRIDPMDGQWLAVVEIDIEDNSPSYLGLDPCILSWKDTHE